MKKLKNILFLAVVLNSAMAFSQNLVPNPSFEEYTACPQGYPDLDGKLNDWMSFRGTPDYLNNCNPLVGSNNQAGFQQPNSGEAYTGFLAYKRNQANLREHLGVKLMESLEIGTKYYISFFVSPGYLYNSSINITCNKLGVLFTMNDYYFPDGDGPFFNYSHIYTNTIISDTSNWTKISGSFVADSSYEYLVVGNFFENQYTDTLEFPSIFGPFDSFYYLDDICVTTDSLYAQNWTTLSINEIQKNNISVYPNPTSDFFIIEADYSIDQIEICNYIGEIVMDKKYSLNEMKKVIDVSSLNRGVYILKIKTKTGINQTQKLVIQNLK